MRRDLKNRQPDPDKKDRTPVKRATQRERLNDSLNNGTMIRDYPDTDDIYNDENDPSGEYRRPLTNHDEQHKATNADINPLGEAEGL
ncbi:hypothetical protein [Chryseosolibacter indicus]|uniref:Uncharacterized protein n=1 Tax=Chryseosolibacter indicus TaxID=2782351 RepID=A0ABS5VLT0_9BACT|nr:hypothetical protein [Chryseosolibacter indicus]MBT1702420.1 hypothetical protein [Chryseosolibacter indicus]